MANAIIDPDMRVWQVYRRYPETMAVFLRHGCPDMRKGVFPLMARMMKIRWAAKVHHIPLDTLMRDLNAVAR